MDALKKSTEDVDTYVTGHQDEDDPYTIVFPLESYEIRTKSTIKITKLDDSAKKIDISSDRNFGVFFGDTHRTSQGCDLETILFNDEWDGRTMIKYPVYSDKFLDREGSLYGQRLTLNDDNTKIKYEEKEDLYPLWQPGRPNNYSVTTLDGKLDEKTYALTGINVVKNKALNKTFIESNKKFKVIKKRRNADQYLISRPERLENFLSSDSNVKNGYTYYYLVDSYQQYVKRGGTMIRIDAGNGMTRIDKHRLREETNMHTGLIGHLKEGLKSMGGKAYGASAALGLGQLLAFNVAYNDAYINHNPLILVGATLGINMIGTAASFAILPRLYGVKWMKAYELKRHAKLDGVNVRKIGVADVEDYNAFAYSMPGVGGNVVFTKGILERLKPKELGAVVYHEFGHIKRHATFRFTMLSSAIMSAYALPIILNSEWLVWPINIASVCAFTLGAFGRVQRREEVKADDFSAEKGFSKPLANGLIKITQPNMFEAYGSHPSTNDRVKRLAIKGGDKDKNPEKTRVDGVSSGIEEMIAEYGSSK